MKNLALLGATGSIGLQTLDLVRNAPDKYCVKAISAAGSDLRVLAEIIEEFRPQLACVKDKETAEELSKLISTQTKITYGKEGLVEVAVYETAETVLVALVGALGIQPTLEALNLGKHLIVANKETLVAAGDLIRKSLNEHGGSLIPADSEHVAIHQCLGNRKPSEVSKVYITASGGPFYFSDIDFEQITVEQALNHPTWSMGSKITIDSATMMNKGLEVIEAQRLFDFNYDQIDVLVHPQSVIHSLVEFIDGNIIAQLGPNDMRVAIQYALDFPSRQSNLSGKRLSFQEINKLEFFQPDNLRFPCLDLAYEVGRQGKTYPAVLCAADEVAVELFLKNEIKFTDIPKIIEHTINKHSPEEISDYKVLENSDLWARQIAFEYAKEHKNNATFV